MNKKQFNLAILYNFNSLGNKQDLPNALDESEIVQHLNVEELVNKNHIPCRIVRFSLASNIKTRIFA